MCARNLVVGGHHHPQRGVMVECDARDYIVHFETMRVARLAFLSRMALRMGMNGFLHIYIFIGFALDGLCYVDCGACGVRPDLG